MSRDILEKILELEKKRQQLVIELFAIEEIVQGSFCLIHVKCGKKQCRCNQGKLHPHYRMSMKKNGKQLSRAVPKEEHEWIASVTDNYKNFRMKRRVLNSIEDEINKLLDKHEKDLIQKTSKGKLYLEEK